MVGKAMVGKAMVANTKPQQWKKEESKRLKGERDKIKFIDLPCERMHCFYLLLFLQSSGQA